MRPNPNTIFCYKCHQEIPRPSPALRTDECPHCLADIHSCKMCQFYDKSSYNDCREPMAERISDKEKANFCDYFKLASGHNHAEEKTSLTEAANTLFKSQK